MMVLSLGFVSLCSFWDFLQIFKGGRIHVLCECDNVEIVQCSAFVNC